MHGFLEHFGYAAVFGLLLVAGVGVPIPEELTQLTAGVLAHEGVLDLRLAIAVVWAGILAGDVLLFELARRHGPRILETRAARRVLTPRLTIRTALLKATSPAASVPTGSSRPGRRFRSQQVRSATPRPVR